MTAENTTMADKRNIARSLLPLLGQNAWARRTPFTLGNQYVPRSTIAFTASQYEASPCVGIDPRLSIILPNNHSLAGALEAAWAIFETDEMTTITTFLEHVSSYEQWSKGKIPYDEVEPFPKEFDDLMRNLAKC